MFEVQAVFTQKQDRAPKARASIIEKIVKLPAMEYTHFKNNLLKDYGFIEENRHYNFYDEQSKLHCLLVTGEGHQDGILVDTAGYNFARYSAYIPDLNSLLMSQYPKLTALNQKLLTIADYICEQASSIDSMRFSKIEEEFYIDLRRNPEFVDIVVEILKSKPETQNWDVESHIFQHFYNASADINDPTLSKSEIYQYGYIEDGILPLKKQRALELFDAGYCIHFLYRNGVTFQVNHRETIENSKPDILFGIRKPAKMRQQKISEPISMEEKPSVLGQIREAQQSPTTPADAVRHNKKKDREV